MELGDESNATTTTTSILKSDPKINSSIGRLALSKNICRFELPMDMKQFEKMTPTDYLEKYCRVSDRRKAFYRRCFDKYKLKSEQGDYLDLKLFEEAIMDVHMKSISKKQINLIIQMSELSAQHRINFQLFQGLAALSERALYDDFVTEDTVDLPDFQKDKIECADFGSLATKLDGVQISPKMLSLLKSL